MGGQPPGRVDAHFTGAIAALDLRDFRWAEVLVTNPSDVWLPTGPSAGWPGSGRLGLKPTTHLDAAVAAVAGCDMARLEAANDLVEAATDVEHWTMKLTTPY
jgi:hypothetical protein